MAKDTQEMLTRVRPPRVKITYDVEIGDAIQKKELPFVGAIIADLAGSNTESLAKYKERKFVDIDRDNLDDVVQSIEPKASFSVPNTLSGGSGDVNVSLSFKSMGDFEPASVIKQISPLNDLFEARQRLNELAAKLDGNDSLDQLLSDVIENTDHQKSLQDELKKSAATSASPEGDEGGKE
jgi:type VI secretion system protein ImpB